MSVHTESICLSTRFCMYLKYECTCVRICHFSEQKNNCFHKYKDDTQIKFTLLKLASNAAKTCCVSVVSLITDPANGRETGCLNEQSGS